MNTDEFKALRLRRTQLKAELARIDALLNTEYDGEGDARIPKPSTRAQFYHDAENDFRDPPKDS